MIDERLIQENLPIPDRVLRAPELVVEHAMLKISGDTKDGYWDKPWFKSVYQMTKRCYQQRYGAALEQRPKKTLTAVQIIFGDVFRLEIPQTLSRIEKEGESAWLIFPTDVQKVEDPFKWLVGPPNLDTVDNEHERGILGEITDIGCALRRIYFGCLTSIKPDELAMSLSDKIIPHLEHSATHLLDPWRRSPRLAFWEAQQAAEHALKLLCRQRTGDHRPTHDLTKLHKSLETVGSGFLDSATLNQLPNEKAVIKIRAGEGDSINLAEAYYFYRTYLSITDTCVSKLERNITAQNWSILFKKPSYL
jgi:hypothetical protein